MDFQYWILFAKCRLQIAELYRDEHTDVKSLSAPAAQVELNRVGDVGKSDQIGRVEVASDDRFIASVCSAEQVAGRVNRCGSSRIGSRSLVDSVI